MQIVKINIRTEQSRYIALMDAMMSGEEVEGGYVQMYTEYREEGECIAKFLLHEPSRVPDVTIA